MNGRHPSYLADRSVSAPKASRSARYDGNLVVRRGGWSVRVRVRPALCLLTGLVVVLALATVGMLIGDLHLSPGQVLSALVGDGDSPLTTYFVQEVRLPRVVAGITVGVALGVAGSIFQNVTGNPLGSPDITGFTTGSATGAVVVILLAGGSPAQVSLGALAGGALTAAAVWGLSRSAGLTGQRLVLVGLGVGATLAAVNTLLVARAELTAAQTAAQWLAGSLNTMLWSRVLLSLAATVVLLAACVPLARPLDLLSLTGLPLLLIGPRLDRRTDAWLRRRRGNRRLSALLLVARFATVVPALRRLLSTALLRCLSREALLGGRSFGRADARDGGITASVASKLEGLKKFVTESYLQIRPTWCSPRQIRSYGNGVRYRAPMATADWSGCGSEYFARNDRGAHSERSSCRRRESRQRPRS